MDPIRCEGAPRDLGLDQGSACGAEIRSWLQVRGLPATRYRIPGLRRLAGGAQLGAGAGRELLRHYPHLGERMSGIARGARVPLSSLMEEVVASTYASSDHPLTSPAAAVAALDDEGAVVIARGFAPELPWVVRASEPEVGFRSVEITLPWLVGGLAGVNEAGIAVVAAAPSATPAGAGAAAAPAWLLVQECLQRFDSLEGALDWCLRRPSAGDYSLLLGDASGEVAVVEVSRGTRRIQYRGSGHAVAGGCPAADASLRKRIAQAEAFSADWLASDAVVGHAAAQVWLRPDASALEWRAPLCDVRVVHAGPDPVDG